MALAETPHTNQPISRLKGAKSPASSILCFARVCNIADVPPPSGLFVSITNCAVCEPFAARLTSPRNGNSQLPGRCIPYPIVSAKSLIEESETLTVVLCVVCTLTEVGFTTQIKEVPAPGDGQSNGC